IKINEFRTGTSANPTNAFIELYNAGDSTVDLSNWTLTEHPTGQPISSTVTVPAGTTLASHRSYLLGLFSSGLAIPAGAGDSTITISTSTGIAPGKRVQLATGPAAEPRPTARAPNPGAPALDSPGNGRNATIASPPSASTPLWQPVPDGPIITVPAGSTNVPVRSTSGFTVGQKLAIGYGDTLETATVTAVGRPGTQARLAATAHAGAANLQVTSTANHPAGATVRPPPGPKT